MEFKWLEDFVLLAQVKSFSKASDLRNITQPAFSRRIQSLELWLGTPLIDRSCFPMELTPAGLFFYEHAISLIENISEVRATLKSRNPNQGLTIDFAVPHNLSLTHFPDWIKEVSKYLGGASYRLKALNVHDAVMTLLNGGSDLLLVYSHPSSSLRLNPAVYTSKLLGVEKFSLYGLTELEQAYQKNPDIEIPFLTYGSSAYLGKIADHILAKCGLKINLKKVYETDMAEGLKSMVLATHGYAFLPESSIRKELNEGLVVKAFPSNKYCLDVDLEVRLFRYVDGSSKKAGGNSKFDDALNMKRKVIENLWNNLI